MDKPEAGVSDPVLIAQDLQKSYGSRMALRSLSFSLQRGRVLGFLGPNGAGKTTSIRVLTTILEPSAGRYEVDGIGSDRPIDIRRVIGVLPEGLGFPKNTTAIDYLTYFGRLFGRPTREARDTAVELLGDVGLQNRAESLLGSYSHGMRQRIGIARALVNRPHVVFLDEPTLGLDPRGQQELLRLIQRIARERDTAVVLSSHLLSEVEWVCDDVVIMNGGYVVAKGPVTEVIKQFSAPGMGQRVVRVRVPVPLIDVAQRILDADPAVTRSTVTDGAAGWITAELTSAPDQGAPSARTEGSTDGSSAPGAVERNRVLGALIAADIPIVAVDSGGGRLQDVFLQLTAETIE